MKYEVKQGWKLKKDKIQIGIRWFKILSGRVWQKYYVISIQALSIFKQMIWNGCWQWNSLVRSIVTFIEITRM